MREVSMLDKAVVFTVDVSQWAGRVRLSSGAIRGDNLELPPEDLASLGSLKIANPEDLRVFDRLKKQATRTLGSVGVRFLGGYAIPEAKADWVANELDSIGADFDQAKSVLASTYDAKMAEWVAKHPGWEAEIRAAALDANAAMRRFSYNWTAFKLAPAESPAVSGSITRAASGLTGQLYAEVAEVANQVIEKSILGRDKANGRILLPLKTLNDKLEGLAFIDPTIRPLADTVGHVLGSMPKGVPIEGESMATLYGLMLILSDPQRMKSHANAVISGSAISDLLDDAKPREKTEEEVKEMVAAVQPSPALPVFGDTANVIEVSAGPSCEYAATALRMPEIPLFSGSAML